ncbi:arylsulfatase [Paraburkholderia dilworthii]|uniref:Arylsulfatase n=1 Tax=Paraburkholderia dilworthii TaxID=948106 RepID=A0ABW9D0P9_9BURK
MPEALAVCAPGENSGQCLATMHLHGEQAMRISFLHTIESNRQVFERAAKDLGLPTDKFHHEVRADLRESVEQAGRLTDDLKVRVHGCLLKLAAHSDAVVLTCATLGPAVADLGDSPAPVLRADTALASAATKAGGSITVLCAAESAIESNRRLFTDHASKSNASVTVVHLPHVWTHFKNGDHDACHAAIASSAQEAYEGGATVVAFAHPWMAPAANLVDKARRPLDSPHVVLDFVMRLRYERS